MIIITKRIVAAVGKLLMVGCNYFLFRPVI